MYPLCFTYVGTTVEHHVQDLYASQKVQVFSTLRRPKTHFGHEQGHQRAGALTGSINNIQNTIFVENGVQRRKTVKIEKSGKRTEFFQKQSNCKLVTTYGRPRLEDAQFVGKNLHRFHKTRSCAAGKTAHCPVRNNNLSIQDVLCSSF